MAITITSPVSDRTFKSNGTVGDIQIVGTYVGSPTAIEASFNGGSYATIDAAPAGGNYSGTLSSQPVGQGTLTVRFTNNTSETASVTVIGVGFRFAIAGQSNAAGYTNGNNYYFSASGIIPTLFGNDYNYKELLDPVDSPTNQVDSVSLDAGSGGSCWPILASYFLQTTGIPIEFIPCALTSTNIASWQPGADHQNRATLYGSMVYRSLQSGGVNGVIYWQGEDDAIQATSEATYNAYMDTLADAIWTDLGCKLMPCTIFDMDNPPYVADNTAVNNAIRTAWGDNSHVMAGPDFADIKATELTGIHFGRPHSYMIGIRWWYALRDALGFSEAIRQSNQYWAAADTINCSFKKNVQAGSLIVVAVSQYGGTIMNATSISDNNGNTYALIGTVTSYSGDSALRLGLYYAYNVNAGATTVTFTGTSTPSITLAIHEYPGMTTSNPLDQIASAQSNSGAPNSGNTPTTTQANELLFAVTTPYASSWMIYTPGTNYLLRNSYTDGNVTNIFATEDRVVSATGAYAGTFTENAGVPWIAKIATFKIAGVAGTEESVSLGKILKVTQPFSGTEDGTTLATYKGVSISEQVVVQGAVSLAKFVAEGDGDLANVISGTLLNKLKAVTANDQLNISDIALLARYEGFTAEGVKAIDEIVNLLYTKGISLGDQVNVRDAVSLAIVRAITGVTQTNEKDAVSLEIVKAITGIAQTNEKDAVSLAIIKAITGVTQTNEKDAVSLGRLNTIVPLTQTIENDGIILTRFTGITTVEEAQGFISEGVTLSKSLDISILQEGISHVSESVSVNRLAGISEIAQCQINDNTILNRLGGISDTTQGIVNDNTILNRLTEISAITQCQVNDYLSLIKVIRITISEETRGQYSENLTLSRSIAISILQEGISHVSEIISINRSNSVAIGEQSKLYDTLLFTRSNGIVPLTLCQVNNNLIFVRSNGLSPDTQISINENITVSKFSIFSASSQLILNELLTLSKLDSLELFDSRYLLENINLERTNDLILVSSPTIFEMVELRKVNILTIMTLLYGFNGVILDQYKSIIAEPPSLYVYDDGNHSVAVLFRDKRVGVLFRDKRASVRWRDKRGG